MRGNIDERPSENIIKYILLIYCMNSLVRFDYNHNLIVNHSKRDRPSPDFSAYED